VIAVFQLCGLEVCPFEHGVIHFNRDHLGFDALGFQEIQHAAPCDLFGLAVDHDLHICS
jgi:hypothetical protein